MTEVIGCGIDIEELNRFTKHFSDIKETPLFAKMVFSEAEIENNLQFTPELTFPLGFSCKEAFFKALGVSWTNSKISWKDIELLFQNNKNIHEFSIRLSGFAKEFYEENCCTKIISSFDFTKSFVTFNVILLSNKK
jgi:phosphopantetheine--protein transferase-like protein